MEWEQMDDYHQRSKVPGGWIVKAYEHVTNITSDGFLRTGEDFRIAMCFVPDTKHEWRIK